MACFENYVIASETIFEHPTKNVQATVFYSNSGAWDSGGFHIVVGIKGATPYWRMAQVEYASGGVPKLTWIGDTLRIDTVNSARFMSNVDQVTTLNGHTIKVEVYKDGKQMKAAPQQ